MNKYCIQISTTGKSCLCNPEVCSGICLNLKFIHIVYCFMRHILSFHILQYIHINDFVKGCGAGRKGCGAGRKGCGGEFDLNRDYVMDLNLL